MYFRGGRSTSSVIGFVVILLHALQSDSIDLLRGHKDLPTWKVRHLKGLGSQPLLPTPTTPPLRVHCSSHMRELVIYSSIVQNNLCRWSLYAQGETHHAKESSSGDTHSVNSTRSHAHAHPSVRSLRTKPVSFDFVDLKSK